MKPVIGITVGTDGKAYKLSRSYCDAVEAAGGEPILLPHGNIHQSSVRCDGIILSGGPDISPCLCGITEYDPVYLDTPSPLRDRYEIALVRTASENDIPLLGICRGVQVMNIALGGTLRFHIDGHIQKKDRDQPSHSVHINHGTRLASLAKEETVSVNSFHHQAIGDIAPTLTISAVSDDGMIEAAEMSEKRFFIGVQWHPECMRCRISDVLFAALCAEAARGMQPKGVRARIL